MTNLQHRTLNIQGRAKDGFLPLFPASAGLGRLRFEVRPLWRPLRLFAALLLLAPAASASITRWDPLPKPLGNANFRGYAQVERELGSWRLPDGTEIPLHLVLQSDPSVEPGPLGPGWHLPFFRSDFVRVKDYEALWEMPNGRRKFFPRDRLAEEPDGDALRFRSREGDWTALWEKDRRGIEATVTSTDDPAWWFRYEDGRLHSFRMGEESPEYRVDWLGGSNFPRAIRPANRRQGPVEILYAGRTPESIRVGEREWELEMDEGDWTAPDGRSDYLAYRVRFLAALTGPDGTTERFGYEKGDLKERTVGVPGAAKAARTVRVPVNRLAVRDGEGNERGFLAWEARSGFLVEDSGAAYAVASEGRDPEQPGYAEARRRGDIAPEAVRIERRPEEGPPQLWSYDYGSGRRERTDPSTGEIFRETHIVSPGPAYGKLRKREKKTPEGKWELVEHWAYDPEGRLLRVIEQGGSTRKLVWEERGGYSRAQEFVDGVLAKERVFENGRRVRTTEWQDGEETTFTYERVGGREVVRQFTGGQWQWTRVWGSGGRLLYGANRAGVETIVRHGADGTREVLHRRLRGNDLLVRTRDGEQTRTTDPRAIAEWLTAAMPDLSNFPREFFLETTNNTTKP